MANPLKRLAGETAIYGLSTILVRVINFTFIPIYTRVLSRAEYGIASELLAYIAILQVILTMGLETGCFRFANKYPNSKQVFSTALSTVGIACAVFFTACLLFSGDIASLMGREGFGMCIVYLGAILATDCFTSILFAKLRYERKAIKFVTFKTIKILTELGCNLLLFFALPAYFVSHTNSWLLYFVSPTPDFTYILFAIFISCLIAFVLMIPDILRTRFVYNKSVWQALMKYSLPLMIAGLPGIANDFIDRILFRFCMPKNIIWEEQLGDFQANIKLAVLMTLFIQMFRYAAEPFFFGEEKNKSAPQLYANVMNHFVAFCMCIFLFITFYIDAIGLIIGKDFRAGVAIVPIMLGAYVLLGINFNLSMWYKLSGKTQFAVYITSSGLLLTVIINIVFMPYYGYHAAAWGHLFSYLLMAILSAILGAKYYPIPYNWVRILSYIAIGAALFLVNRLIPFPNLWVKWIVNTALLVAYAMYWMRTEKVNILDLLHSAVRK